MLKEENRGMKRLKRLERQKYKKKRNLKLQRKLKKRKRECLNKKSWSEKLLRNKQNKIK